MILNEGTPLGGLLTHLKSSGFMLTIAILAIHRSCAIWFERNLCFLSAFCTSDLVHFSRAAKTATSTSIISIHVITSFVPHRGMT